MSAARECLADLGCPLARRLADALDHFVMAFDAGEFRPAWSHGLVDAVMGRLGDDSVETWTSRATAVDLLQMRDDLLSLCRFVEAAHRAQS